MKGRVEDFKAPMSKAKFDAFLNAATDPPGGELDYLDVMAFLTPLRELSAMFEYLRDDDVITAIDSSAAAVELQLQLIELHHPDAAGLSRHWDRFYPEYFRLVSEHARTWAQARIVQVRERYAAYPDAEHRDKVLDALREIEDDIPNCKYPSQPSPEE